MMNTTFRTLALTTLLLTSIPLWAQDTGDRTTMMTHPLMPGVRCDEINNPNWPRTLHDKHITGFSPLTLGMTESPRIWATIEVGGAPQWIENVQVQGESRLLVYDGRLRLIGPNGRVEWASNERARGLVYCGDIRSNGRDYLLVTHGPRLTLIDAATGVKDWTFAFEDAHVGLDIEVADILSDQPGLEAAVFQTHGIEACLIQFPPQGEPQLRWRVDAADAEVWPPVRADHGVSIKLDLSDPDRPMIWNVRHHRLLGFDARSGAKVSPLAYNIGGSQRRNYGPWAFGAGPNGEPLVIVVGAAIEAHVHALRLDRDGPSTMAWQQSYGTVYQTPGVVVRMVAIDDVDGDGATEVVYNVRDPAHGFRSFVQVRDGLTGTMEVELADQWALGAFDDVGDESARGLLVLPAPGGTMPNTGNITVYKFSGPGRIDTLATVNDAQLWGPHVLTGQSGNDVVLRQAHAGGAPQLVRYSMRSGKWKAVDRTTTLALLHQPIAHVWADSAGDEQFQVVSRQGTLQSLTWSGRLLHELPLQGVRPPTISAVDLNADGRAELIVGSQDQRLHIYSFDPKGNPTVTANYEYRAAVERHGPLLYDLDGNGNWILIAPGTTPDNHLTVRAYRSDGSPLWETPLPYTTANDTKVIAANAANALPGGKPAVVVHVTDSRRTVQDTVCMNGQTGQILWTKDGTYNGMPYRPEGIVSAVDIDNDGLDELANDMLAHMAFFNGEDGSFALIRSTHPEDTTSLYNSFIPLYKTPDAIAPHWLVPSGLGNFGMMRPDYGAIWSESAGYDVPGHVGIVDVDGDGVLEAGYAIKNSRTFKCRNVWTGDIKWQLELDTPPNSPVLSADIDGDGKGEFLAGRYVIGANALGQGEVRFELPVPLTVPEEFSYGYLKGGAALIADFNGDGLGDIACTSNGRIVILTARRPAAR